MSVKLTQAEFIARSQSIEASKPLNKRGILDYSRVIYVNDNTPVDLGCSNHFFDNQQQTFWFKVIPTDMFQRYYGCPICENRRMHYNNYSFNFYCKDKNIPWQLIDRYTKTSVKILCQCLINPLHQHNKKPNSIIQGFNCSQCSEQFPLTNAIIDQKLKEQGRDHLIYRIGNVVNNNTPIDWGCFKNCKKWTAAPKDILNSRTNCPSCAGNIPYTLESFIKKTQSIGNNKNNYNYSYITEDHIKNAHSKVPIWCNICEIYHKFEQSIHSHINRISGCPFLINNNEKLVYDFLVKLNITNFQTQYNVKLLNKKRMAKADFYFEINGKKVIVEYNGRQHYQPIKYFGGDEVFINQIKRDQELEQYCNDNNILLISIDGRKLYKKSLIKYLSRLNKWFQALSK